MIIDKHEIRTPADYPWAYDPAWRHAMGKALLGKPKHLPQAYDSDEWIRGQYRYLRQANSAGFERYISDVLAAKTYHPMQAHVLANRLYTSTGHDTGKDRVEAMLLCPELDYGHIAHHSGLDVAAIEAYQHLFFACRNDEGKLMLPRGLMQYFATRSAVEVGSPVDYATLWRQCAFEGGARYLFSQWTWKWDATNVVNFSEIDYWTDLLPKLYRNIDNRLRFNLGMDGRALIEAANLVRQALADLRKAGIVGGGEELSDDNALMQIVRELAPHALVPGEGSVARAQDHLEKKLATIGKDVAPAESAITRQLTKRLGSAGDEQGT